MFNLKNTTVSAAIASALSAFTMQAQAASFETDNFTVEWDTVVTAGMQFRIEDRNERISRGSSGGPGEIQLNNLPNIIDNAFIINSNDGNSNFDTGLTSMRLSMLTEADINFGDSGVFIRGKFWQDYMYGQGTDIDEEGWKSSNTNPVFGSNGGYTTSFGEHNHAARDYARQGYKLLDAFVYTNFMLPNDQEMTVRLGRQVVSWGEALLSGGGLATAINHVDAHIRNQPGLELKELFLPTNSLMIQTSLTDTISLEAYYQFEWNPAFIDPSGSLFSEFDSIGDGGEQFMFVTGWEDSILGVDLTSHLIDKNGDRFDPNNWCDPNLPANQAGSCGSGEALEEAIDMLTLAQYLPTNCRNEGKYNYSTNKYDPNAQATAGSNDNATCRTLVPHKVAEYEARDNGQFGIASTFFLESGAEMGLYFVNYHEKIPSFILPIDAIETFAPVIELLINFADGCNPNYCNPNNPLDPNNTYTPFNGINDLGDQLTGKQLNALLQFLSVLPEVNGTVGSIANDLVENPEKLGLPNFAEIIADTVFQQPGYEVLIGQLLKAVSWAGADFALRPSGFSTSTPVRNINYRIKYYEDVQMIGATYSTVLGTANVATELTYRMGTPMLGGDVARTPRETNLINWHINTLMVFEPVSLWGIQLWDFASFTAEALTWYAINRLEFDANDSTNKKRLAVQNSPTGLGISAFMGLEYYNVFSGWDVNVPLYMNWGARGAQFNAGYRDGQITFATGLAFKHLSGLELGTGVTFFFGDEDDIFQILTSDRDNAQIYMKYSF